VSKHLRGIVLIIIALVSVFFIVQYLVRPMSDTTKLDYSAFYQKLEHNQVQSFHAVGEDVSGELTNGNHYTTTIPNRDQVFVDQVLAHVKGGVNFDPPNNASLVTSIVGFLPFIVLALFLFIILRQAQNGGSQALSFGRSRAKMLSENRP
jgi:cell division protease FtsH